MAISTKLKVQPSWAIIAGLILLVISYFMPDTTAWWLARTLQVLGIVFVIFGIILASAKLNSGQKP